MIDHQGNNYASNDDIISRFKTFKVYISKQELLIFIGLRLYI